MKKLLLKEYKLTVMPLVYAFLTFACMLFIPSYPYTVVFFYITLAIFFCFLSSRENKDLIFMMTLPIPKEDIVKSRYGMVISIEFLQILLCIPFCIIRSMVLTYQNKAGIEANVAFLGLVLIQMAAFNAVFLGIYFKNVSRVGIAFLAGSVIEFVVILAIEISVHVARAVNGSCFWDESNPSAFIAQIPIFIAGLIVFVLITVVCFKRDVKNFLKQDL